MAGTFTHKTRTLVSPRFVSPLAGRKNFIESAQSFRLSIGASSKTLTLDPDYAVKAAMAGGMALPGQTDDKKRENKGGPPGMKHEVDGYRLMPNETAGPGKVLRLFPSFESRNSAKMEPNFGFLPKSKPVSVEEMKRKLAESPLIRMEKYQINPRNGEKIEGSEKLMDPLYFNRELDRDRNPDLDGIEGKSLGDSIGKIARGNSLIGRVAQGIGVVFDELGKMRCPPGTPAANQFTDANGSNCFGVSLPKLVGKLVELAREAAPEGEERRSAKSLQKRIANFIFDFDNSRFGRVSWYDENGKRMGFGEYRKYRDKGGVAEGERWFVNAMVRAEEEFRRQGERVRELQERLGIDSSDAKRATNADLVETIDKLRENGVINTRLKNRDTPDIVEARIRARLEADPTYKSLSREDKEILVKGDIARYYETERASLEAFIDEVIKNPEHIKDVIDSISYVNGRDEDDGAFSIGGIVGGEKLLGNIDLDITHMMGRQESEMPNLKTNERLRIYAEGGKTEAERVAHLHDFLVNSNAFATNMACMVEGPSGIGRHTMKHEIAHSIQAKALHEYVKNMLATGGSIKIGRREITDPSKLTAGDILKIMRGETSVPLDAIKGLQTRGEAVSFLAGRYIWEANPEGTSSRSMEIGAELWALRSLGLIFGDDVDAALEYMDDFAYGKTFSDRAASDADAIRAVADSYYDAGSRIARDRAERVKERYIEAKNDEIKRLKERAKTMSEDDIIDMLLTLNEDLNVMDEALEGSDETADSLWREVADRDAAIRMIHELTKAWAKRFTVLPSREAMERLEELLADKMADRGTLPPDKVKERAEAVFMETIRTDASSMSMDDLVNAFVDAELSRKAEGLSTEERDVLKKMAGIYRDEYIKRRTSGVDSVDREDAVKELKGKLKEKSKPETIGGDGSGGFSGTGPKKKKPAKKFDSHNGKNGARTHAISEREKLLEQATAAERDALVEMGDAENDTGKLLDPETVMGAIAAIARRRRRAQKLGIKDDPKNRYIADLEQQLENILIPFLELMDKSSLSETIEIEATEGIPDEIIQEILRGELTELEHSLLTGRVPTSSNPVGPGKVVIRVPEGSKGIYPDWSFDKEKDDGIQRIVLPSGDVRVAEIREDGTIVLEVVSQKDTEAALDDLVKSVAPGDGSPDTKDWAQRKGAEKKIKRVVDKHINKRREEGRYSEPRVAEPEKTRIEDDNDSVLDIFDFPDEPSDSDPSPDKPKPKPSNPSGGGGSAGEEKPFSWEDFGKPKPKPETPKPKNRPSYGRERRNSTAAINRVVEAGKRDRFPGPGSVARDELQRIQEQLDGTRYTNYSSSARKVTSLMREKFGTDQLSDLTDEQLSELIDDVKKIADGITGDKRSRSGEISLNQKQSMSRLASSLHDFLDIRSMIKNNNYSDPYEGPSRGYLIDWDNIPEIKPYMGGGDRMSSGKKWGSAPSGEVLNRAKKSSRTDELDEIFGMPQSRTERIGMMHEQRNSVLASLRDMLDRVPGAEEELGLNSGGIDPVVLDLIKNSSDEEISEILNTAAKRFHSQIDSRPRVRMRTEELDAFVDNGRYGRESRFSSGGKSRPDIAGVVLKGGLKKRAKDAAISKVIERFDLSEEERDVAEIILDTTLNLRYGPQAALTGLAIELARRGGREVAERTLDKLVENGKITRAQADSVLSKIGRIAPDGLPDRAVDAAVDSLKRATEKAKELAESDSVRAAGEKAKEVAGAAGDKARDAASAARDKTRSVVGRLSRRAKGDRSVADIEALDSPETAFTVGDVIDDPFGLPPSDSSRFSSGATRRKVKNGSVNKETETLTTPVLSDTTDDVYGIRTQKRFSYPVHTIDGQKVSFGGPKEGIADDVERLPINPYAISGLDRTTKEGRDMARKWITARAYHREYGDKNTEPTYVDALLYAASRGDSDAAKELDELSEAGEKIIARMKGEQKEFQLSRFSDQASSARAFGAKKEDLFFVHAVPAKFEPEEDEAGNVIIRPLGDHELKKVDGTPGEHHRGTIHFAVNHYVDGHEERTGGASTVIIVPMTEMIDSNPDSLENLYPIDSWMVPPPGSGLKVPKGKFKIVKTNGDNGDQKIVDDALVEMGMKHPIEPGRLETNTRGAAKALNDIAAELGATSGIHNGASVSSMYEGVTFDNGYPLYISLEEISRISPNGSIRIADGDRWTSAKPADITENTRGGIDF